MTSFPRLFEPLQIAGTTVRNRILQPAHSKLFSEHAADTRRDTDYHVARAKGGVGLLITGERLVHPSSPTGRLRFAYSYLPDLIDRDRAMTAAVHDHGAAIFAQLNHVGVEGASDGVDDLRVLYGPSEVASPLFGEVPKKMEARDIAEVVEAWATGAEHSREGGFDGVEIHLAHGYLLHQFLSPLYNRRDDEYGGPLENRVRLTREVVAAVRERVGADYPVGVRLGLTEFVEGGLELEDAIEAATLLTSGGQVDFINTSAGGYHSGQHRLIAPSDTEDAWLMERVAALKASLEGVPVFAVGALRDPAVAEEVIAAGHADMVGMTRALIADPELPNKVRSGRASELYTCIKGNQGCISRVWRGLPMACTVNPRAGREAFFPDELLELVGSPGRQLVVGGGPAGLKAAETLASRGHEVTLLERQRRLGGQINLLVRAPGRESFGALADDLARRLDRLGVDVRLDTAATVDAIRQLDPDQVLLATGATPDRTGFSSAAPHVDALPGADGASVVTGWDVLRDASVARGNVVVLDDQGTRETAGVAEVLLDAGRHVELVTRLNELFPATATTLDQPLLYERLLRKGLIPRCASWADRVGDGTVTVYNLYTRARAELTEIDTVVLCTGRRAEAGLYFELLGAGLEPVRIGDCLAPRTLDHAVYEGFIAGLELAGEERFIREGQLEAFA